MGFYQRFLILTGLACVIALMALARRTRRAAPSGHEADVPVAVCLAVVTTALVAVGIVSNTVVRHLFQIAPLLLALALVIRGARAGVAAAAPLFAFWLLAMGAVWLLLLGIARIVSGRFTPTEIALTLIIGGASLAGLVTTSRKGTAAPAETRTVAVLLFGALQYAALWLSTQPFVR